MCDRSVIERRNVKMKIRSTRVRYKQYLGRFGANGDARRREGGKERKWEIKMIIMVIRVELIVYNKFRIFFIVFFYIDIHGR